MVEELVGSPTSAELQTIARPALRALVRDCGTGAADSKSQLVEQLIKFADDAALRADRPVFPPAPPRPSLLERGDPVDLRWSAHDAGAVPVYDAAALPGDRLLLALGELGCGSWGGRAARSRTSTSPLRGSWCTDHGSRALAIAARGQVKRVARIDLIERRGAHWCDAEFDECVDTFDGDLWLATRGREVFAVDTTPPAGAPSGVSRWIPPARSVRCAGTRGGSWSAFGTETSWSTGTTKASLFARGNRGRVSASSTLPFAADE